MNDNQPRSIAPAALPDAVTRDLKAHGRMTPTQ